jgi:hypothetical protein
VFVERIGGVVNLIEAHYYQNNVLARFWFFFQTLWQSVVNTMVILLRRLLSTDSGPAPVDAETHEPCSAAARERARIVPAVLIASALCFLHGSKAARTRSPGASWKHSKPWQARRMGSRRGIVTVEPDGFATCRAGPIHAERPADE